MKKFSELTDKEKYTLGVAMGERLIGTASYPDAEIEVVLTARDIEPDEDPTMDAQFCNGLDDTALMCDDCNWYCPPYEIGDFGVCSDCCGGEGEEE